MSAGDQRQVFERRFLLIDHAGRLEVDQREIFHAAVGALCRDDLLGEGLRHDRERVESGLIDIGHQFDQRPQIIQLEITDQPGCFPQLNSFTNDALKDDIGRDSALPKRA